MSTTTQSFDLLSATGTASNAHAALVGTTARMQPVSLEEVDESASLQKRVDHKYLLSVEQFSRMSAAIIDEFRALQIEGKRVFGYESVYFDTPDLQLFRDHRQSRRRRFKIRTRTYLDSAVTLFEVKLKGGRGETSKYRIPYPNDRRHRIDEEAQDFIAEVLQREYGVQPPRLEMALKTSYRRGSLVDLDGGSRLTCDVDLECSNGRRSSNGPDRVLLESKSVGGAIADSLLSSWGVRPVSISKYCVGSAMLHPQLPANRWNRLLRQEFGWRRQSPELAVR